MAFLSGSATTEERFCSLGSSISSFTFFSDPATSSLCSAELFLDSCGSRLLLLFCFGVIPFSFSGN